MEEEEDDDIYAPSEAVNGLHEKASAMDLSAGPDRQNPDVSEGEEEGEEVEEDESESVLSATLLKL